MAAKTSAASLAAVYLMIFACVVPAQVYSGAAPQNPNLDPILFAELPWFSNFELAQMTKWGMPGVYTHAFMDGWSPGYLGSVSYNHNGMMRMYETQSGREAGPGGNGRGDGRGRGDEGRAGGPAQSGGGTAHEGSGRSESSRPLCQRRPGRPCPSGKAWMGRTKRRGRGHGAALR